MAWVQHFTYVRTGEGWLFVTSVLDLRSRRLFGYSMADHMRTELVLDARSMAVEARDGAAQVGGSSPMRTGAASTRRTTTSTSVNRTTTEAIW